MARYAGLLLAPAEGFGLQPRLFSRAKKSLLCCLGPFFFVAIFGVTLKGTRKKLKKSKKIPPPPKKKNPKKSIKKNLKLQKNVKNGEKIRKFGKNLEKS